MSQYQRLSFDSASLDTELIFQKTEYQHLHLYDQNTIISMLLFTNIRNILIIILVLPFRPDPFSRASARRFNGATSTLCPYGRPSRLTLICSSLLRRHSFILPANYHVSCNKHGCAKPPQGRQGLGEDGETENGGDDEVG